MLTTLTRAKTILQINDNLQDSLLEMLLESASAQVESETGRNFAIATYNETHKCVGNRYLLLDHYPVVAINSITADGQPVGGYNTADSKGILTLAEGWNGEITVSYTAGYARPPADIEIVVIRLAGIALAMTGSEHLESEAVGPLKSVYLKEMPLYLQKVLDRYRKPVH